LSLAPIVEKEKLDAIIRAQNDAKKEASVGLPEIKKKMTKIQGEINKVKD